MISALISPSGSAPPAKACPTGADATSPAPVQNGGFPAVLQVVTMQQAAPETPGPEAAGEEACAPADALPGERRHTADGDDTAEGPIPDAAALLFTGIMLCPLQGRAQSPGDGVVVAGSPDGSPGADAGSIECSGRGERAAAAIAAQVMTTAGGRLVDTALDTRPGNGDAMPTSQVVGTISDAPLGVIEAQPRDQVAVAEGDEGSVPEGSAAATPTSRAPHATRTLVTALPEVPVPEMVAAGRAESGSSVPEIAVTVPHVTMVAEPSTLQGRTDAAFSPATGADALRGALNAEAVSSVGQASDGREFEANAPVRVALADAPRQGMGDFAAPSRASEQHQGAAGAPVDEAIGVVPVQSHAPGAPPHRETPADAEDRRDAPHARWQDPPAGLERVGATGATGEPSPPNTARAVGPARESISQMGMERVLSAARTSTTHGGMEVRLRLHPEALGEVSVQIRWEGGVLSARLETATQAAREALENGAHALRTALQEQGIPVERLSVGIRLDLEARSHPQDPGPPPERGPAPEFPPSGPVASMAEAAREPESAGRLDIRI